MKPTIGEQLVNPEGSPDDFQHELEQQEKLGRIGSLPEVRRSVMRTTVAKAAFDKAKENIGAAFKYMQEQEERIVNEIAMDTAAANELCEKSDSLHYLLEVLCNG